MIRLAERLPAAVGVKVAVTIQLAPAAKVLPQVVVSAKSPTFVPLIAIEVIVSEALPLFDTVTA
jgi:hypothetical protein